MAGLSYRPDIDGLRAVAVLPVVLYHAGFSALSGGIVGVDVFFVISGYLITGILLADIGARRFSLLGFYERRARRILPALFAVMLISGVAAFFLFQASAFEDFSESVLAATFFASNIYFWQATDYFSTAAEYRILLHTWSLAVEEQFYILWPLLLLLLPRKRSTGIRIAAVTALLGLSLLASILAAGEFRSAGFYLLPTRAWELMIGAALALGAVPRLPGRRLNFFAASLGVSMILIAAVAYDSSVPFPGIAALLPCLGTALVIHAGSDHPLARVLAWPPLVLIGLISYSLYLWHWPILAFLRIGSGTAELPVEIAAAAVAVSLLAAYLSWRWVELPFRRKGRISRRGIFSLSLAGAALCVLLSSAVIATEGLPRRLPDSLRALQTAESDSERYRKGCMNRLPKDGLCRIGTENRGGTVLLWGDSHASTLVWALDVVLKSADRSGYLASQIACPPLLGVRRDDWSWPACVAFNDTYLKLIESGNSGIDTVVLSARWALTATGKRAAGEAGKEVRLVEMDGTAGPGTEVLFARGLENLAGRLRRAGVRVVLLGGVPEIGWDVPATLALRAKLGLPPPELPTLSDIAARNAEANEVLSRVAQAEGIDFVRIAPLLCRPTCRVIEKNLPLYVDDDHLSAFGAGKILGPELIGKIL